MVYRFKLVSDEVDHFLREIEIDPEFTFADFRIAILDSVGYSKDEMDSFFICDEEWNRQQQIAIEDFGTSSDEDIWLMEDTRLSELIEEKGQKLVFIFDNIGERAFFMALTKIDYDKSLSSPLCVGKSGMPPVQISKIEDMEIKPSVMNADDLGIDQLYGEDAFNEDEIQDFDNLEF